MSGKDTANDNVIAAFHYLCLGYMHFNRCDGEEIMALMQDKEG